VRAARISWVEGSIPFKAYEIDKTLKIVAFIPCNEIDDVYFDKPYYLAPN
jgi:non-homologous end joining protein Ku